MRRGLMAVACMLAALAVVPPAQAASNSVSAAGCPPSATAGCPPAACRASCSTGGAIEDGHGAYRGERWQCQANRRMATVTIVAGKAADIRIGQR